MRELLQRRSKEHSQPDTDCQPQFFRLTNPQDREQLQDLLVNRPSLRVFDELFGQLTELVKSKNPQIAFSKDALRDAAARHLGSLPPEDYGVWVYYPWADRLVHILDQEEFVFLRTSRNQYKITPEEQQLLSTRRIGVVGLSVGQSVAVTMAMERLFGEIRLADFDTLELTNLNRIRTGLHNLGQSKAVAVAREILELDPFLKVVCHTDGLHDGNINDFFLKDGKLDLLVEECDGIDMKIIARYKARELSVPVVMETSDRGMLDVERFDLEPQRPILHGLVGDLNPEKLKTLKTAEEKLPYMLPVVGFETLSTRLKASALEIGQTITTWPQLASAVAFGGGLAADVVRRVLLGQFRQSGRWYVDPEELVGGATRTAPAALPDAVPALADETMRQVADATGLSGESILLSNETILELVTAANLAPSAGNNQPWRWLYRHHRLFLFLDKSRIYPFWHANDVFAYLGLGAALENLTLKAQQMGFESEVTHFPNPQHIELAATISFSHSPNAVANPIDTTLAKGINLRLTNRLHGNYTPLTAEQRTLVQQSIEAISGADLHLLENPAELAQAADMVTACERMRFLHPEGHREFFHHEIRWNREQAEATGDGLDLRTFDLTLSDLSGLRLTKQPEVISLLRDWRQGKGLEKFSKKLIANASAVGLVSVPRRSYADFMAGGRAVQRVWLAANVAGLAYQPVTAPLYMLNCRTYQAEHFSETDKAELDALQPRLAQLFGLETDRQAVFLFRLAVAAAPAVRSLRRPVHETLVLANDSDSASRIQLSELTGVSG